MELPGRRQTRRNATMPIDTEALRHHVTVKNAHGLHFGPCTVVARLAMQFQSSIVLSKAGKQADAKRVLDLATLGAFPGDELELEITGDDATAAMQQFLQLFDRDFFPEPAAKPEPAVNPEPAANAEPAPAPT